MKVKTKILLWSVFWYIARALFTGSVTVATLLTLWNYSYTLRGYYALGGEVILVVLMAVWAHISGKVLHEYHMDAMCKVLEDEGEKFGMIYGEHVFYLEQQKSKRHKKRPARKQAKNKI